MVPKIDKSSFVAESAVIIGSVKIGKNCGIFPNAVIRGDQNEIIIEEGSNVQDCAVIHTNSEHKVKIGKNVSIGHGAIVHGAIIDDNVIVGMHATIMNGAIIGKGSIIGANSLVTTKKQIPIHSLVMGVPGKVVKQDKQYEEMSIKNAGEYHKLIKHHRQDKYIHYRKI
jgi:carbonic anhydrase/acetyltransferase-like protein (isoleucine patch superfamily)